MATNNELDIIARTRYEVCSLFFQEELWPWQLFIASIMAVITRPKAFMFSGFLLLAIYS